MFRRARHQKGSLQRVKRKSGQSVWIFRWYEIQPDENKRYRKVVVGTVEEFKTFLCHTGHLRELSEEVDSATLEIVPAAGREVRSGGAVAEIPSPGARQQGQTQEHHERPVQPRHSLGVGDPQSHHSRPAECEAEKNTHRSDDRTDQGFSFASGRALPYCSTARRIQRVEGGGTAGTEMGRRGLRSARGKRHPFRGEAEDHPLQDGDLAQADTTRRGVGGGPTELEASVSVPQPGDWVFASPHKKGKQPYWPGSLFRARLKPALKAAPIHGNVGWHTLRHTFGTLMKANGEDIKTIQELLRHSNYKVTADTYTQAVSPTKRAAQTKLVKMILLSNKKTAGERACEE